MSKEGRIILGVALLVIAAGFFALVGFMATMGDAVREEATYGLGGLGLFSVLGALACFVRASRPMALRILGACVLVACLAYVGSEVVNPTVREPQPGENAFQAWMSRRSRPSLLKSLGCFALFGLPAGYVAITGRYPAWGRHARAFGGGGDGVRGG